VKEYLLSVKTKLLKTNSKNF